MDAWYEDCVRWSWLILQVLHDRWIWWLSKHKRIVIAALTRLSNDEYMSRMSWAAVQDLWNDKFYPHLFRCDQCRLGRKPWNASFVNLILKKESSGRSVSCLKRSWKWERLPKSISLALRLYSTLADPILLNPTPCVLAPFQKGHPAIEGKWPWSRGHHVSASPTNATACTDPIFCRKQQTLTWRGIFYL